MTAALFVKEEDTGAQLAVCILTPLGCHPSFWTFYVLISLTFIEKHVSDFVRFLQCPRVYERRPFETALPFTDRHFEEYQ